MVKRVKRKIKKVVRRVKRKVGNKPFGIMKVGKRFAFAFGTRANPRQGRKMFNKRSSILAFAKKKGFIK